MTTRDRYRELCADRLDVPLFQQAWWLDATCGVEGWNVALSLRDGRIVGALPFADTRRFGLRVLTQPALTQFLGPWIAPTTAKTAERLGREKDILEELIAQLPPYAHYSQAWNTSMTNWLAFHWAGFNQTTRYTYVIDNLCDEATVWSRFQSKVRGDVRKAGLRFSVRLRAEPTLDAFVAVNNKTFERQGICVPYSRGYLARLDEVCASRGQRKIFLAEDADGRVHAGAYIVWDSDRAYYLAGGGDPDLRNSGATSYCLWEAIRFAATVSRTFDFEGSMMEPVERFFRGFGAEQVPYFHLTRTPSPLLRVRAALLSLRTL
ncbi:MAG: GNAT family N-acetyltransferase [Hyphomicrobiaceae bacterium]|nr:GNAT family N-acetyltransferase [Hyphomicrobiaceae bacterium]